MKNSRVGIGAILLASAAILATPLTAEAAHGFAGGGRGGGGGMHFGGGGAHFGGGGMHFGGGGGGMRLGGGGGAMRLGGVPRWSGSRVGGPRVDSALRSGGLSRQTFKSANTTLQSKSANTTLQSKSANSTLQTKFTNKNGLVATRVASTFSKQDLVHQHNAFLHKHHFRRFAVFGWVGPLFWPYAYSDIYCDIFWGYWGYGCADPYWTYGYGNPFWDYGYGDIYGGVFSPFAFNDLTAYLPSAPGGGRRARSNAAALSGALAQMCGDDTREVTGWPIDRIRQLVSPDDQQRMALEELADTSVKAAQIIKTACPTSVAFTPTGRLAAMQQRIEAMEQAIDVVHGPLETFYGALTDEQKAKFNSANQTPAQQNGRPRGLAQSCAAANAATQWPEARIEAAIRPNEAQQVKLKALQSAATQAAEQLAVSCPSELPTTPLARLAAVSKRLEVMLGAVKSVRGALDDLYGDLSDEQKAQFNRIGQSPSRTAQRQG